MKRLTSEENIFKEDIQLLFNFYSKMWSQKDIYRTDPQIGLACLERQSKMGKKK